MPYTAYALQGNYRCQAGSAARLSRRPAPWAPRTASCARLRAGWSTRRWAAGRPAPSLRTPCRRGRARPRSSSPASSVRQTAAARSYTAMASRSSAHSCGSTSLRHRRTYPTAAPSAASSAGVNHRDSVPDDIERTIRAPSASRTCVESACWSPESPGRCDSSGHVTSAASGRSNAATSSHTCGVIGVPCSSSQRWCSEPIGAACRVTRGFPYDLRRNSASFYDANPEREEPSMDGSAIITKPAGAPAEPIVRGAPRPAQRRTTPRLALREGVAKAPPRQPTRLAWPVECAGRSAPRRRRAETATNDA